MDTVINTFICDISDIKKQYTKTNNIEELKVNIYTFSEKYKNHYGVGDYLLSTGEKYITDGDYSAGIVFIKTVNEHFSQLNNKTLLYLRMAEFHFENNNIEEATKYLLKLCTDTVSNYEESIEINEMTDVWLKYKHLVEGKVPKSISVNYAPSPLPPTKCSMQISEIFSLSQSDIPAEISIHLCELSANGDSINCLNKWEKVAFYIDELLTKINSGGFEEYLYYYGHHFEKSYNALKTVQADKMLSVMKDVQAKFPKKKVPKSLNSIQNILDKMENSDTDFETENSKFYESGEKELLDKLLEFVLLNKMHFR